MELKLPKNIKELRSLLVLTSFFRKFIPNYTQKDNFKIKEIERNAINKLSNAINQVYALNLPGYE